MSDRSFSASAGLFVLGFVICVASLLGVHSPTGTTDTMMLLGWIALIGSIVVSGLGGR